MAYFLLGHITGILTIFTTFKSYKVVKRYNSGKLGNITIRWLQIFSGTRVPIITKIEQFLTVICKLER